MCMNGGIRGGVKKTRADPSYSHLSRTLGMPYDFIISALFQHYVYDAYSCSVVSPHNEYIVIDDSPNRVYVRYCTT